MVDGIAELGAPPESENPQLEPARRIAKSLADYIRTTPIQNEATGETMKVEDGRPEIRDGIPTRDYGQGFRFWGGIETGFRWATYGQPSAIIKDLRIPTELRGQGMGKSLVGVWEQSAQREGITEFAATNIKDEEALKFWTGLGYQIPPDQMGKAIPYCMVKKVT